MSVGKGHRQGPVGGVRGGRQTLRPWKWRQHGRARESQPVRCRRDVWYLARARLAEGLPPRRVALLLRFVGDGATLAQRCLRLDPYPGGGSELLGWIQTPPAARRLQLCLPATRAARGVAEIVFHHVSERDPKCHPMANVPRWSVYQPAVPIRCVLLPRSLAALRETLAGIDCRICDTPRRLGDLCRLARGTAWVLDPAWAAALQLQLADVEHLAHGSVVIADLQTIAQLLRAAHVVETEIVTHTSANGIMSARVEYADFPTRGFAHQDVVPYTVLDGGRGFRMRVLRADRAWRQHADEVGFATLLSSETPWAEHHGDVLSAARPVGRGELIITDLPWLVAGHFGPLLAPRVAAHLLRMHLGLPLGDHCQYWNRWEDTTIVVRDLAEFARRYPPLQAVRWAAPHPGLAHLGITLLPERSRPRRHLMIRTGRIDTAGLHDGVPPEPMTIFMKWLAREAREQTAWARRYLPARAVTWQFDTADGLKYAVNFDSAAPLAELPTRTLSLRMAAAPAVPAVPAGADAIVLAEDEGLFGDGSLAFQDTLTRRLRRVLELS